MAEVGPQKHLTLGHATITLSAPPNGAVKLGTNYTTSKLHLARPPRANAISSQNQNPRGKEEDSFMDGGAARALSRALRLRASFLECLVAHASPNSIAEPLTVLGSLVTL
jgi:hypothetical protein